MKFFLSPKQYNDIHSESSGILITNKVQAISQEQLRNIIRDLHSISHELSWIKCAMHGQEGKRLESAKDDLTSIRLQLIEQLDGQDGF